MKTRLVDLDKRNRYQRLIEMGATEKSRLDLYHLGYMDGWDRRSPDKGLIGDSAYDMGWHDGMGDSLTDQS